MFTYTEVSQYLAESGLSDRYDALTVWGHLDSWRRLGPNQMGKPCGRGWVGLRGACKRSKHHGGDKSETLKASKLALADKIRKRKGMKTLEEIKKTERPKTVGNYADDDFEPDYKPQIGMIQLGRKLEKYEHALNASNHLKEDIENRRSFLNNVVIKRKPSKSRESSEKKIGLELAKLERRLKIQSEGARYAEIGESIVRVTSAGRDGSALIQIADPQNASQRSTDQRPPIQIQVNPIGTSPRFEFAKNMRTGAEMISKESQKLVTENLTSNLGQLDKFLRFAGKLPSGRE